MDFDNVDISASPQDEEKDIFESAIQVATKLSLFHFLQILFKQNITNLNC